jgi:SAM-dependent methyltransferase
MHPPLRDIYDSFAETYEANRDQFDMSGLLGSFFEGLAKEKGRLLDLGCGAGEPFPRFFLDRGWEVYGVDFSKKMLRLAAQYAPEMHTICDDMLEVDFEPAHFDAVTCIYSLFHVPHARHPELFAKFRRWLRPGGKALFTYASREYTGQEEFEGLMEFMGRNFFYSHTTPGTLRAQLETAGLSVESADLRDIGGETFLWVTAVRR